MPDPEPRKSILKKCERCDFTIVDVCPKCGGNIVDLELDSETWTATRVYEMFPELPRLPANCKVKIMKGEAWTNDPKLAAAFHDRFREKQE